MRRITASFFGILLVFPSFAGAKLPSVNVAGGGVSARAMFGESIVQTQKNTNKTEKKLVSRNTAKKANAKLNKSDFLVPNRPSSDLWASSDTALRMPSVSEFSVLDTNYQLPEEKIDTSVAYADTQLVNDLERRVASLSSQLSRLEKMQKKSETVAIRKNADVVVNNVEKRAIAGGDDNAGVKLTRLVVGENDNNSDNVIMRPLEKNVSPRIAQVRDDMSKMSPSELRKAFRKTFLSENKHLSAYSMDDGFDEISSLSNNSEGFTAQRDLSENGGIRPLEIKISFRNDDSALSRDNYNLLSEYAGIVVSNPKRAIQVAIPQRVTATTDGRKLAAKRLAIVEQVLRDTGVAEQRIVPVLSQRDDESFVLRIISNEQYETLTKQKRNMFGDSVGQKIYKSMTW